MDAAGSSDREGAAGSVDRGVALLWAVWGAVSLGGIGALVGVVIGVAVHPPTAVFAAIEVGLPSSMMGFVVGLGAGVVADASRRRRRRSPPITGGGSEQRSTDPVG